MDKIIKATNVFAKYTTKETFSRLVEYDTIPHFLNKIDNEYQDLPAIRMADGEVSYHKLISDAKKVGKVLEDSEIKKGANVGILAGNNYNFVKASIGTMGYGAVATLLPMQLDEKSIYGCTLKYQLTCLFYEPVFEEKVMFAKNLLPNVNFIKITEFDMTERPFSDDIITTEPACIVLTGGTTGRSKGAILSHKALLKGTLNGTYGVKDIFNQVYYSIMPLTHVFGFIRNLLTSLYTGSVIYFCSDMRALFKEIKLVKPTIIVVVPALAEIFLNLCKQYGLGFVGGNLKTIICGGASVPGYLVTEFHKLGINFCPGYGLTESANLVSGNPEGEKKPTSVGFLFPDQEIRIVNDELWLKGDNLMSGYYNEPEENKNAYVDGWFKTGDLVRIDEEGFLYIIGRIKDIIVSSTGENISPAYLEGKINALDFIQDTLVYEKKNELGVKILVAEVLLRKSVVEQMQIEDTQKFVENEIEKINQTLNPYEQIGKVIIRDTDFVRSPSMKIIRPKNEC